MAFDVSAKMFWLPRNCASISWQFSRSLRRVAYREAGFDATAVHTRSRKNVSNPSASTPALSGGDTTLRRGDD